MKYNEIIVEISLIFNEFYMIVETISKEFNLEKKQDPELTEKIVENSRKIIKKYKEFYQFRIDTGWTLDKDIKNIRQNIRSFHREFDNPFLGSKKWYQKIIQLQNELSKQAIELDKLAENI